MIRRNAFLVPFATISLAAGVAMAQSTSGDLVGTVKDATGALLPGAKIMVTNEDTKVSTSVTAGGSGEFRVSNLLPGSYDLTVSSAGFQTYTLTGIAVDLNKTATSNVTLSIGSSQTVEVSAESGVVLDTTSTNLSQTFGTEEIANLPTASVGLGVLNVSLLSPGVASSGGLGIGVGPSVGGQRPRNNNFTIEGIDNNDKSNTGPLLYIPNDAVGNFTLITNQFSPEFGHSSGGQFNTTVISGTNKFHGKLYEYFQNRDLDAATGTAGGKLPLARYDNNRYGAQLGGPIFHDKLFFFANYERSTENHSLNTILCTPTAAGLAQLQSLAGPYGFSQNNLTQYLAAIPAANLNGGAQVDDTTDAACGDGPGLQSTTVTNQAGTASTAIPFGNYQATAPLLTSFYGLTTSVDYTVSQKDSLRVRYIYNHNGSTDDAASLPSFFTTTPQYQHLFSLSEFHVFTPNLTNEVRLGFNRNYTIFSAGNFSFPGLDQYPNLDIDDQALSIGPDGNAPQGNIQNFYNFVDNVSYVKGKHTIKVGFDGRKYISPQFFTQRFRGDYEYSGIGPFLLDQAPDQFGQRSTGSNTYYGDQTAFYGYGNDTWRVTPTVTLNYGLRYEFTSVPEGEKIQALNAIASVPGVITFHSPKPDYKDFAPRVGISWAPDQKTSVRAAFGMAYDVLFDNLGLLSVPPEFGATESVGDLGQPDFLSPNFFANGGLKPSSGSGITVFPDQATAAANTSGYTPDVKTPYAESYTLTIQRTIGSAYTAEVGYTGTRGIHLPTQDQINIQPKVTPQNQLPTSYVAAPTFIATAQNVNNLQAIENLSRIVPAFAAAGFTSPITSYQPYSSSNYNGLITNLQRRFEKGLQLNLSYTWSKTMDDATAEVFATVLTPRRPQSSQNVAGDYSRSALDRTHRVTLEALYDVPYFKHSNSFLMKNLVGNWTVSPIYTYESPEYATVLSGDNANLNGDSGSAISRALYNGAGVKNTSTTVHAQYSTTIACPADSNVDPVTGNAECDANLVGYIANDPNAQYVQAGRGTLPNTARNTLPTRPINNFDLSAFKRITFRDRYNFEFGAQAFNVLNHAQYTPGSINNVNNTSFTANYNLQTVGKSFFNHPENIFQNNARSLQLSAKIAF